MRILLSFLCLLFISAGSYGQNKQTKVPVPDQFIVSFNPAVIKPIDQRRITDNNRIRRSNKGQEIRAGKESEVRAILARYGIAGADIRRVMVDGAVGAIVMIRNQSRRDSLKGEPAILQVTQDVVIQMVNPEEESFSDPIMQGIDPTMQQGIDPTMQSFSEPIMQLDPIMQSSKYDIDSVKKVQKGILKVGGPVSASGKTSVIWVLDTGVDPANPQLVVETNTSLARSFVDGETTINDMNGHGTHCAGLAAAKDLGNGVAGVSAGARVVPVKVLSGEGRGTWASVIAGLNHVAQYGQPGDVVNISFGSWDEQNSENTIPMLTQAIRSLSSMDIYVVMSAGNDAKTASKNLPGLISGEDIFTAASIDIQNAFKAYSNFNDPGGIDPVDLVVPGHRMMSLWIGAPGTFRMLSGTSMAAAVLSGIIHASLGSPAGSSKVKFGENLYLSGEVKK